MNVLKVFSFAAVTVAIALTTACSGKSKPGNAAEELMSSSKEFEKAEATMENVNSSVGKPIELGENDILEFDGPIPAPVVVDFSASWCGPCRQMHPIFDKLSRKYHGQVRFIYVDIDKAPQLAKQYGVEGSANTAVCRHQGTNSPSGWLYVRGRIRRVCTGNYQFIADSSGKQPPIINT